MKRRRRTREQAIRSHHPTMKSGEVQLRAALARRFVHARRRAGLTQYELAKLMGWTQMRIAHYETGRAALPAVAIAPLCRALQIEPNALLLEHHKPHEDDTMGINTTAPDIAALLRLPEPYKLIAFFDDNTGYKYALVQLIDCDPSHFATYRITADDGRCDLGHYFGEKEFAVALKDFLRRAGIGELLLDSIKPEAMVREMTGWLKLAKP